MNKKDLIQKIKETTEKHLRLPLPEFLPKGGGCNHESWGFVRKMFVENYIICPECGMRIDDPKTVDFIQKIIDNDKREFSKIMRRIEFIIEDFPD